MIDRRALRREELAGRRSPGGAGRGRARAVLEEWGDSPLSRIALLPGYEYLAAAGGKVVIPFTRSGRFDLALGDPVGPAAHWSRAAREFADRSRSLGRRPAFVSVSRAGRAAVRHAGLRALRLGLEGRMPLPGFDLRGSRWRSLRGTLNRARREGTRFEVWEPPLPPPALASLAEVSNAWLALKGGEERRFGAGWFHPDYIRRSRVAVVLDRRGRPAAFANLVEGYRPDEASADLMRRRADAPVGAMDALFAGIAMLYRAEGRRWLNLGLAPLAGLGQGPAAPWPERALGWFYRRGARLFDFGGLYAFKNKFHPAWTPRYLAYDSLPALPAVLLAAADLHPWEAFEARSARWAARLVALAATGWALGRGASGFGAS